MSVYSADLYTPDGRLRGSYVYMLLCQIEAAIFIKIGRSSDPFSSLHQIRNGCPVVPEVLSVAELPTIAKACRVETDLHRALKAWHSHLEWFRVLPAQRCEFNAAWKPIVAEHSTPSRRFEWRNYSVAEIIAAGKISARTKNNTFMRRGKWPQNLQNVKR